MFDHTSTGGWLPGPHASEGSISRFLDRVAHPRFVLADRDIDAFLTCQALGIPFGVGSALLVAQLRSLSGSVTALACVIAVAVSALIFLGLRAVQHRHQLLTWIRGGVYHYQLISIGLIASFLLLAGRPVHGYLDAVALGWATCQLFGRVGCFMAGCCYGRPCSWGVRYGSRHMEVGHVHYLSGVRLIPVQLIEVGWLVVVVSVGFAHVLAGAPPGTVLAWYLIGYGAGRFQFEFLRADADRRFVLGFSEAQWVAMLLGLLVLGLGLIGTLTVSRWHAALAIGLAVEMVAVAVFRKVAAGSGELWLPERLRQLIEAIRWTGEVSVDLSGEPRLRTVPTTATTSTGIEISSVGTTEGGQVTLQYGLYDAWHRMSEKASRELAELVIRVHRPREYRGPESSADGVWSLRMRMPVTGRTREHAVARPTVMP